MEPRKRTPLSLLGTLFRRALVVAGAFALTLAFFLVLPLMQTLTRGLQPDTRLQTVDTANVPPPPPPPEEEPPEEEEEPEEPPELEEQMEPLDLSQLELALNPGFSDGMLAGDFEVKLNTGVGGGGEVDSLFSMADLDQKPRAVFQPSPTITPELRKRAPGTVYIIFVVDKQGRVENPIVQSASDPIFEKPALAAIRQWKFEPGKRQGQPVRFRMRVPITFPQG